MVLLLNSGSAVAARCLTSSWGEALRLPLSLKAFSFLCHSLSQVLASSYQEKANFDHAWLKEPFKVGK